MSQWNHMDPDIEKLVRLLKKIIKKHPQGAEQLQKALDSNALNLNLCFLTVVAMSPEEMDGWNQLYEDVMNRADDQGRHDLEFEITHDDIDFLKENGLSF